MKEKLKQDLEDALGWRDALQGLDEGDYNQKKEAWWEAENALADARLISGLADRLVSLHPDDARLHAAWAITLQRLGESERAERHYRLAVAADPLHAATRNNLGAFMARQGRLAEASAEPDARRPLPKFF